MTSDELRKEYINFVHENEAYFEDVDENSWYTYACWLEQKIINELSNKGDK